MKLRQSLEEDLNDLFENNAPPLPSNAKKILVEYLPYINLLLGAIALLTAWDLYDAARAVSTFVNFANNVSTAYGGPTGVNSPSAMVWISIGVLIGEALLYIAAFPGMQARKKFGWDLLLYAFIINIVYGIAVLFTTYGGVIRLFGTIIGSVIGFYLLFQIRDSYGRAAKTTKARKTTKKSS